MSRLTDDLDADTFGDTVTWKPLTGQTGRSVKTFGSPVTIPCMIQEQQHQVIGADGKNQTAVGLIYLNDFYQVKPDDEIVMPDGSTPRIAAIEQFHDDVGPYATVVHTGN